MFLCFLKVWSGNPYGSQTLHEAQVPENVLQDQRWQALKRDRWFWNKQAVRGRHWGHRRIYALCRLAADLIDIEFAVDLLEKEISDIDPSALIFLNQFRGEIFDKNIVLSQLFFLSPFCGILFCPEIWIHVAGKLSDFFKRTDLFHGSGGGFAIDPNGSAETEDLGILDLEIEIFKI